MIFVTISLYRLFKGYYKFCQCGCRSLIPCFSSNGRFRKFKSRYHIKGSNNNNWKGGRRLEKDGYAILQLPNYFSSKKDGHVFEHIYFYQEYHKCCMLKWGVVHHIIPVSKYYCNNMPWNLMGMTKSQHQKLHRKFQKFMGIDMTGRICFDCLLTDPYRDKNGIYSWRIFQHVFLCHKCSTRRRRQ